ncbi:acyltransferase family protein [Pseudomonas sp. Z4-7]|uniref:acyltransferase n=1 Tax=Pseudomonas sp. Z4-7 TaxID=2817413 RepID=UPI003DA9D96F
MNNETHFWIHLVKLVAIVMVVLLHVAAPYHYQLNTIGPSNWAVVNLYEAIVRPCVPLFFMASGFLLLNLDEPATKFFFKRFSRIAIPLAFWTVIYVLWKIYYQSQRYVDFGGVLQMFFFPVSYHLWFMYALIGCYLFLPMMRKISIGSDLSLLIFYCGVWFCAVSVLPLLQKYYSLRSQLDLSVATGYMGYFVLGYLLGKRSYNIIHAFSSVVVIVLSTFMTSYFTFLLTLENRGVLVADFTSNFSPTVIFGSAGWFVFIKYVSGGFSLVNINWFKLFVISISNASFGIYLVHVIFLDLVADFFCCYVDGGFLELVWKFPIISLIVFFLSYIFVSLLARFKFGRIIGF